MAKGCSNCGSQEEWYPVGDGGLSRCPNCFMTVKTSVPRKAAAERSVVEAEAPSVTLTAEAERELDAVKAREAAKAAERQKEKAMEDKEKSRPKDEVPAKEKVIEPPEPPADKAAGKATGGRKT